MQIFPTGSGKSYMQKELLQRTPGLLHVVPSVEIAEGVWLKLTGSDPVKFNAVSEARRREATETAGIYTSKRLLNLLMDAKLPLPKALSFDECHHTTDDTHSTLHAITGLVPAVGWTATGYRGTPQETKKLHDTWPVRVVGLTLRDAVDRGIISQPSFATWPLLNDDEIAVTNGEFKTSAVDSVFKDKFKDIVARIKGHRTFGVGASGSSTSVRPQYTYLWDRPTMVAVSSKVAVTMLVDALNEDGFCAVGVTADTPRTERDRAFARTIACETILVQINVVSEGVDLPLRRLIDLSPTMSPVRWVQRLGRIKRPVPPGEVPPEYIACCHNITRHGYLEAGVLPVTAMIDAQKAWGEEYKPTRKSLARAIGLDGFGRFQVSTVPLSNGLLVSLYALQTKTGLDQYSVILHPAVAEPYFFHKQNVLTGEKGTFTKPDGTIVQFNVKEYGPWKRIEKIPDISGCLSIPAERVTEKMVKKTWPELAGRYGLDPTFEPDGRTFQILPICWGAKPKFPKE